jgi:hypothetical protein
MGFEVGWGCDYLETVVEARIFLAYREVIADPIQDRFRGFFAVATALDFDL